MKFLQFITLIVGATISIIGMYGFVGLFYVYQNHIPLAIGSLFMIFGGLALTKESLSWD